MAMLSEIFNCRTLPLALLAALAPALPSQAGETVKEPIKEAMRPAFTPPAALGIPADYRSRWKQLTPVAVSGMHWNQSVVVYSNKAEETYLHNQAVWWEREQNSGWSGGGQEAAEFKSYQPGTVLIKEGYNSARKGATLHPTFLAIMVKHEKGFDPEYGDWEYVQSTPQGQVLLRGPFSAPGISTACGNCHTNVTDRDYVFSTTGKGS